MGGRDSVEPVWKAENHPGSTEFRALPIASPERRCRGACAKRRYHSALLFLDDLVWQLVDGIAGTGEMGSQ